MYNKEFKNIFEYAEDKVDDIEIILVSQKNFSVRINQQNVESFTYSDSKGIGVRVIKNGNVGYSYSEDFADKTLQMIVDNAVENSRFTDLDQIPALQNYPDVKNKPLLYSPELAELDVNKKVQFAKDMEKYAQSCDERIINVPYASFGDGSTYHRIANSRGLDKEEKLNFAYAFTSVLAADGNDKRMAADFIISRDFKEFDARKLAEMSCRKAIDLLGGREIKTGKYAVVFDNEMMPTLLDTFSDIFSAKTVQEGKSLLLGKINTKIADEKVTLVDDALHPQGFASQSFDSEGYPSQKTILIESGKLVSFLHNTQTAIKDKTSSTANGARNYKGPLTVAPTNFYLLPGNISKTTLLARHKNVIEIVSLQGMHSGANSISGDFSLSAEGFLYEDGNRKYALKQFTVSGNFLNLLQDVEEIADDFKFNMSSIGSASVLIKELSISG